MSNTLTDSTMSTLPTVREAFAKDSAYWGENRDWLIAYSTNRDADCLGRSNWRSFINALGGQGEEGSGGSEVILPGRLAIEEANHWACGWVQYLVISPEAVDLIAKAESLRAKLEDYPVLDEMDWSNLEYEEYNTTFADSARGEFRRYLKDYCSDRALDLIEAAPLEVLQSWFEDQIPSGEYQVDGYPQFDLALGDSCTRKDMADLLLTIRTAKPEGVS